MSDYPPMFQELYSISDIHMGGVAKPDGSGQIFNRGKRLEKFCHHLAGRPSDVEVVLVLNGDVIDSLPEPDVNYVALDEESARRMMKRIFADPAFSPVWDGLAAYAQTENRHLVFVAGNHDIELGLPIVEHMIRQRLSGGDPLANNRITFSARGAGYACRVGEARVHCTHGNEFDPFNRVDNEKLGQLANAQNAQREVDERDWIPNAGTRLVVDVMNDIKDDYPFVDVLKPQEASVTGLLAVLGWKALMAVNGRDALRMKKSASRSAIVQGSLLSVDDAIEEAEPEQADVMLGLLGPELREYVSAEASAETEDDLLMAAAQGNLPDSADIDEAPLETLGWGERLAVGVSLFRGEKQKKEAFRKSLKDWVNEGPGPHRLIGDDDHLSKSIRDKKPNVEFTVAGHTHRARSIEFADDRLYFNSGTWIRLLQITEESLDKDNFDVLWTALKEGGLGALDELQVPGPNGMQPLMDDFTTAVRIRHQNGAAVGDLVQVTEDDSGAVAVESVPGSEKSVSA